MKSRISAFVILCVLATNGFPQNPKSELSLLLYSNELLLDDAQKNIEHYMVNGFQYKRSFNKGYMMRLTTQFSEKTLNFFGSQHSSVSLNRLFNNGIGIEKVFSQRKARPYFFVDLSYRLLNTEVAYSGYSDFMPYYNSGKTDYTKHSVGSSIGFGIKYYPMEHVFINIETAFGVTRDIFDGSINPQYRTIINPVRALTFGISF